MRGNVFYAKNNFGIAHFSLFVINAWKYIFNAIIFIHAAFIHKIKVFLKILMSQISNVLSSLYFSYIFTLNTVFEKISGMIFKKINIYFYFTVLFCLKHNNVVYRWKAYNKTNILIPYSRHHNLSKKYS